MALYIDKTQIKNLIHILYINKQVLFSGLFIFLVIYMHIGTGYEYSY